MLKEQQRAEYKQQQMNAPIPRFNEGKGMSFFIKYNTTVMEAIDKVGSTYQKSIHTRYNVISDSICHVICTMERLSNTRQ